MDAGLEAILYKYAAKEVPETFVPDDHRTTKLTHQDL